MNEIVIPAWALPHTDLSGRTVAVIGGSGGVGEGVVRALLDRSATVVATGRDQERLGQLAARVDHPSLHTTVLDGLAPDLADRAAALVAEHGRLTGVVVSVASWGGQGRKPVLALTDPEWTALVEDNLTAVFRIYRELGAAMTDDGVLLQLNGLSADIPFPGNGVVALTAAAGKSMTRTVAVELQHSGRRVYEVLLGVVRTRARQEAGIDDARWLDGTDIGLHVAELVAGTSPLSGTVLQYFTDKTVGPTATPPEL
jgi:NAD(P)-dependent dehydrogenase (short-subunit alcohol dehydrogenase family)